MPWGRGVRRGSRLFGRHRLGIQAKIYLVGAGPGDPDLLTVKAQRLIQTADTVVYDRLVSREILDLIPASVSRVYVGKATNRHTLSQEEINALLVNLARKRQRVVRLKGGDPFIFGRGGSFEKSIDIGRFWIGGYHATVSRR